MRETLEPVILFICALQVGVLLAATILILVRYARHRSMFHITLVASSYLILTALVSGSAIYRMFFDGVSRDLSMAAAMFAFLLGDYALWYVWRRPYVPEESWKGFEIRISENERRLKLLEGQNAPVGTEDDPVNVKVIGGPDDAPTGTEDDPINVKPVEGKLKEQGEK